MLKSRWYRDVVKKIIKPAVMNLYTTGFMQWKADHVFKKHKRSNYILVSCLPKSGSTFLSKMLSQILDFDYATFVSYHGRIEQDLYEPKLIDEYGKGFIIHQHLRAGTRHLELIKKYDLKVIVLTRNIYDIIVSFYDHIHNENPIWFMIYVDQNFFDLESTIKMDMVIDFLTPWIINYYVSWMKLDQNNSCNIYWLTYEEFIPNKKEHLNKIIQHCGYSTNESKIDEVLERKQSTKSMRINKGVSGRGVKALSSEQKERIQRFAQYYPDISFSKIGL